MLKTNWFLLAGMTLLVVLLIGCPGPEPEEADAVVRMLDNEFEPKELRIREGDTVRWDNAGEAVHTATAEPGRAADPENISLPEGAEPFDSGSVPPGSSFTHTFDTPGTYRYICVPHEEDGMLGTIIVEPAE